MMPVGRCKVKLPEKQSLLFEDFNARYGSPWRVDLIAECDRYKVEVFSAILPFSTATVVGEIDSDSIEENKIERDCKCS